MICICEGQLTLLATSVLSPVVVKHGYLLYKNKKMWGCHNLLQHQHNRNHLQIWSDWLGKVLVLCWVLILLKLLILLPFLILLIFLILRAFWWVKLQFLFVTVRPHRIWKRSAKTAKIRFGKQNNFCSFKIFRCSLWKQWDFQLYACQMLSLGFQSNL